MSRRVRRVSAVPDHMRAAPGRSNSLLGVCRFVPDSAISLLSKFFHLPFSEAVHVSDRSIEDLEVDGLQEREGLPSNYRMRADRHYVDQLAAPATGQPVRMLPIAQVELE